MKKEKGIVFYTTSNNELYYINRNGEHLWLEEGKKMITNDSTYRQIVIDTAKLYTYRGYKCKIQNKLLQTIPNINTMCWINLDRIIKNDFIFW